MAVKVVTDSTADLPPEVAEQLGVTVVPLTVFFGDEAFKDGVEITNDEFFTRLTQGPVLPRTTQPAVGEFLEVYQPLIDAGHEIVSIHISAKLSGTMNSAQSAREQMPGARIELVDTQLASLGEALAVEAAAKAAKAGASVEEVASAAREAAEKTELYFVLDTLEYLQKGARIGRAQALIGGLLSIKPVLKVIDGEVAPFEKIRSKAKAHQRLREIASEGAPWEEIAFCHMTSDEEVQGLTEFLTPLSKEPVLSARVGTVIGTYTGPGVVGVALRKA